MSSGNARIGTVRSGIQTNSGGLGKYLAVVAGTNQDELSKAGANVEILGVTLEIVEATNARQEYAVADGANVVMWECSEAINRLTSSVPTKIISAANGRCAKLPSEAGTYNVVGEMDNSADGTSAAGDLACVKLYATAQVTTVSGS